MTSVSNLIKDHPRSVHAIVCLVAFLCGFMVIAGAQAQVATTTTTTTPVRPVEQTISLAVHGGRLIKLNGPATNVFVADPDIADVQVPSPTALYVLGKRSGRTNVYALDQSGTPILTATVVVSYDVGAINSLIGSEMPGQKIGVHSTPGAIVLNGEVENATDAQHAVEIAQTFVGVNDKVINQISVSAPNQVNLRVRIAEMSHTVAKQIGFHWDSAGVHSPATGKSAGNTFGDGSGTSFNLNGGVSGSASNPFLMGFQFVKGNFDVLGFVDALAQQGIITTLAEPNLTAISGETASFLAGGEFPIPVAQSISNGVPTISVEFKQFGVGLNFTPTVLSADRISLKVRPEVSQISDQFSITTGSLKIPGIQVRRAETTVELASGQSFSIAGLMDNRTTSALSKLPGAGDLPIIGPLFQSSEFKRDESELVIIVTPYIVKPITVAQNQIPTPLDQWQPSSDVGRIWGQHLGVRQKPEGSKGPTGQTGQGLMGDNGFYY